ncbi:MAG: PTS transporter subunit EIIC [Atopobiaceae bacterium]|nr:PTS transporter subunit EIIC [Atopobiaceae bacterium]
MDINNVSRELLAKLGGASNIVTNDACASRLRVSVRTMDCVDVEAIRNIDGVMGVVESDTLQIVFGPGVVNKVLDAFIELTGIPQGARSDSDVELRAARNKSVRDAKQGGVVRGMLKHVANVFVPLLPGIVAAGLINGLTNVVNVWTHGAMSGVWWYESIRSLGWALFAYLPIFAGYNAAREFGGSPILGGIVGALCVANSSMPLLQEYGGNSVILPMTGNPYNPAHGGLVAALLAGGACAWLERRVRKVMPSFVDTFASPLITLIVMGFAVVVALQPLGDVLTSGVYAAMEFVYSGLGVLGGYMLAAGFLPLVSVGMHTALTPIHAMLNDPSGPTGGINYLLPVLMMAGGGQVGAGAALYLKSKNQRLRGYVRDAIPVGVLGVGEPLMYAVTLPLGRPFVTACLGAGVGGVIATALHVGAVSQGASGLFGVLIVQPNQQVAYVVALLGAVIGGFVLTWFFGVDDERIDEVYPPAP